MCPAMLCLHARCRGCWCKEVFILGTIANVCGHMCSSMSCIIKPCSHCRLRPPGNMPQKNGLHSPFLMCRCQLVCPAAGSGIVAEGRLLDLLRRLYCFGVSLMKMDLRQESTRHTEAVDAITRWAGCSPGIFTGVLWGDALKPLDARRSGWPDLSHSIMTFALPGWQLFILTAVWRGAPRCVTQQGLERWSWRMLLFCSQSQQYLCKRPFKRLHPGHKCPQSGLLNGVLVPLLRSAACQLRRAAM